MRFALLGDHPDGRAAAAALAAGGRHELTAYTTADDADLRRWAPGARRVPDPEEVLADPAVEAVIVAGRPDDLAALLRRALQSERHVLCVYPPGETPDIAYETDMIRKDVGRVLLPLLPGALHPAVRRLAEFLRRSTKASQVASAPGDASPIGAFRLLEMEQPAPGGMGVRPTFPGWDLLRALGGEIAEVSALAAGEHAEAGQPVLASGRFEAGGLFQATFLPGRPGGETRLAVVGEARTGGVGVSHRLAGAGLPRLDGRIRRSAGRGVGCVGPVAGAGGAVRVGRGGRGRLSHMAGRRAQAWSWTTPPGGASSGAARPSWSIRRRRRKPASRAR